MKSLIAYQTLIFMQFSLLFDQINSLKLQFDRQF
jgi:hypothetical protein